ncbi:hypothetical protein GALL_482780 [mine drainage metagenome]|uniref:Uncharacterized protein n=1 Tax=mine drainage metagenome TaxID=410659 RepID=A0A1J5PER2_9ZZZZ
MLAHIQAQFARFDLVCPVKIMARGVEAGVTDRAARSSVIVSDDLLAAVTQAGILISRAQAGANVGRIVGAAVAAVHSGLRNECRTLGKYSGSGSRDHRSGDAVATRRNRGDAGNDIQLRQAVQRSVMQRRVHVVRAGGRDLHAIHHDLDAFVVQAMQLHDAGLLSVTDHCNARRLLQPVGSILRVICADCVGVNAGGVQCAGYRGGGDRDIRQPVGVICHCQTG